MESSNIEVKHIIFNFFDKSEERSSN